MTFTCVNYYHKIIVKILCFRFECPDSSSYAVNYCYFKGRAHYVGEAMAIDILPRCMTSCTCQQFSNNAQFLCTHVNCPDLFHNTVDLSCVNQYDSLNDCCSSRQICGMSFVKKKICTFFFLIYIESYWTPFIQINFF